jgi:CelD/BcsL family acetyltransferase involved in cellulose biosynthesis
MKSHGPSVRCRVLTDDSALLSLEAEWRQLFREAAYATPFASWDWAHAWWQNFGEANPHHPEAVSLMILAVYAHRAERDELIGLAPCYYQNAPARTGRPRILRLFGDRGEVGDSLTEERVVLLKRGREQEATGAILSYLNQISAPGKWDAFSLRFPYSARSALEAQTGRHPYLAQRLQQQQTISTEMLELPRCWEAYRSSLSKSMRDNIAYYPRLLSRKGYAWRIRSVIRPAEMPEAIDHLMELHRMRAESTRGIPHANHLVTLAHQACVRQCLSALAADNMARILLLEVGSKVIGAMSLLENAGMQTVYYTGFDPAFYDFSPLTILNAEAIRSAIERGVCRVNFLAGTSRWNARWGATTQPLMHQAHGLKMHPRSAWRVALHLLSRDTPRGAVR